MYCIQVSSPELLDCFDNDHERNIENNAWNVEHNAEKLQEILSRIINAKNYEHN